MGGVIIESKTKKGKLLEIGLLGKNYETKKRIIILYFYYIGIAMIFFAFAFLAYLGKSTIAGSDNLALVICSTCGIIIVLLLLFVPGQEIDGIYEKGLTHRNVGLIKKIQGKHWLPWNEVEKIYYGKFDFEDERGISEYIRIISGNKDSTNFIRVMYDKHNSCFYSLLMRTLKEKCPQAQWIKKDE